MPASTTHARGPMGIEVLCIYKYVVRREGQVRACAGRSPAGEDHDSLLG